MLFHELDDYTMTEAMKWYPKLKESFDVRVRFFCADPFHSLTRETVHRTGWRRLQHYAPLRGRQRYSAQLHPMSVYIYSRAFLERSY